MIIPRHGLTCLSPKTTDLSTPPKKHQALSLWSMGSLCQSLKNHWFLFVIDDWHLAKVRIGLVLKWGYMLGITKTMAINVEEPRFLTTGFRRLFLKFFRYLPVFTVYSGPSNGRCLGKRRAFHIFLGFLRVF